jgi:hypothetical protein
MSCRWASIKPLRHTYNTRMRVVLDRALMVDGADSHVPETSAFRRSLGELAQIVRLLDTARSARRRMARSMLALRRLRTQ